MKWGNRRPGRAERTPEPLRVLFLRRQSARSAAGESASSGLCAGLRFQETGSAMSPRSWRSLSLRVFFRFAGRRPIVGQARPGHRLGTADTGGLCDSHRFVTGQPSWRNKTTSALGCYTAQEKKRKLLESLASTPDKKGGYTSARAEIWLSTRACRAGMVLGDSSTDH